MSGRPRLSAVVELRALLFWRRLRGKGGAVEGVATGLLFLLAIPGSILFATLVGSGSYRAARLGQGPSVGLSLAAMLFGVWQTWTALSLSLADRDALDLRRFLAFPIAPGRVYALGLATGLLADPFAVFWVVVLGGVFAGAAVARPGAWLALLALDLALLGAATVALVTLVQEVGARLSRARHYRVLLLLVGVVGWAVLATAALAWTREPGATLSALGRLKWIAFPPALASAAARRLYGGDAAGALPFLAGLAAATAACGYAAFRVALATARAGGEGGGPARAAAGPGPLARLEPLLEKELRFLLRSPLVRLYVLLLPAIAGVVSWRVAVRLEESEVGPVLPLLVAAAYAHLVTQPFWLNAFGWERGGARLLFLAPVELAAVLRAKNRAAGLVAGALFALAAAAALTVGARPPAWAVAAAVALHVGLGPALHAVGNVVSIWNPRAAAFGAQRAGHVAPASALAGMAILSGCGAVFALPVLWAAHAEQPWLLVAGWAALGAVARVAHRATLPRSARFLARRRDALLAAICGQDE